MLENAEMVTTLPSSDIQRARQGNSGELGREPMEDEGFGLLYDSGRMKFGVCPSGFAGTNKATAAGIVVDDFRRRGRPSPCQEVTFAEVDFAEMGKTADEVISSPDDSESAWIRDSEGNVLGLSNPMHIGVMTQ